MGLGVWGDAQLVVKEFVTSVLQTLPEPGEEGVGDHPHEAEEGSSAAAGSAAPTTSSGRRETGPCSKVRDRAMDEEPHSAAKRAKATDLLGQLGAIGDGANDETYAAVVRRALDQAPRQGPY